MSLLPDVMARTERPVAPLRIRLMAAGIFKFLFPSQRGAGRSAHIGLPAPVFQSAGLWAGLDALRTDFCMPLGSLFPLTTGAGWASVDLREWDRRQLWGRHDLSLTDSDR